MKRFVAIFSVLVLSCFAFVACGDDDDDGGSGAGNNGGSGGATVSCTLNESDTEGYVCTQAPRSVCEPNCTCEGDENNTAVEGTTCPDGEVARCTLPGDSHFVYYNYEPGTDDYTAIEEGCAQLGGTFTTP